MSRSSFAALLKKYQSGQATKSEIQIVEQWYALMEEKPRPLTEDEYAALEYRLWRKVKGKSFEIPNLYHAKVIPTRKRGFIGLGLAASIILALAVFYLYPTDSSSIVRQYEQYPYQEQVVNKGSGVLKVDLEDGSKVMLNPGSKLSYPTHFANENREVALIGEAFFEVSENPDRPFLVYTGEVTTKVLGTSFRVSAPKAGSNVEVSVKTGKVSVYEKKKTGLAGSGKNGSGVILSPNHRVTFVAENKLFVTGLVENPVALSPGIPLESISYDFDDIPLGSVLAQLENAYSIDIEVEKTTLNECPLTANLSKKGLYAQLDLICAAIEGNYEVKGTTILISGKGCE
jgi:ferric-dicitrate binding protein FerR (iron transport regulator)